MSQVFVHIPSSQCKIKVTGETIQQAIDSLCELKPEFNNHLIINHNLAPNAILFLNNERVFSLNTFLQDGDEIIILNAIAGG